MSRRRVVIEDEPEKRHKRVVEMPENADEIIRLIADGYDTIGVAAELGISRWTARDQIRALCQHYGCSMKDLPKRAGMTQRRTFDGN